MLSCLSMYLSRVKAREQLLPHAARESATQLSSCVWCRLNFRLTQACGEVLKEVCTDVCMDEGNVDKACGGTVLRCLGDKIDDITDEACKSELLYFQKMEVSSAGLFCAVTTLTLWACHSQQVC